MVNDNIPLARRKPTPKDIEFIEVLYAQNQKIYSAAIHVSCLQTTLSTTGKGILDDCEYLLSRPEIRQQAENILMATNAKLAAIALSVNTKKRG